jgi:hypothetical protein
VITTFTLPLSGRNLGGMLSHVFRPMMTAFLPDAFAGMVVTLRKKAMSVFSPLGQGRPPRYPIPICGSIVVATIMYSGLQAFLPCGLDMADGRGWV